MMTEKIKAWSFSRYNVFAQCPGKAKLLYIEKMKEPSSAALENGTAKHAEMENFLKGRQPLPDWVHAKVVDFCVKLAAEKPAAELEVAFNREWKPVDWFSKDAWARIKIDALSKQGDTVRIIDWKTGKVRDGEYDEQLELYALTALLMFPTVNLVSSALVFVDHGVVIQGEQFTREDLSTLLKRWEDRVTPMLEGTEFPYTPNSYCKWCHFRRSNGTQTCDAA